MIKYRNYIYKNYEVSDKFETNMGYFFLIKKNNIFKLIKFLKNDNFFLNNLALVKLSNIKSKYLVNIEKIYNDKSINFIEMEYIENAVTFRELLEKDNTLSFNNIINILKQIATGIDILHRNNLSHLDLVSNNILIDNKLQVKLNDFDYIEILHETNQTSMMIDIHLYIAMVYRVVVYPYKWNSIKYLEFNYTTNKLDYSSCIKFFNSLNLSEII